MLALESWSAVLLLVWRLDIVPIVAGASRWQLEGLDGEWEVLVIGIVDQEPVVDVLLEALGLVAGRDEGAGLSSSGALLNAGGLGESLVVSLHSVDDNPPLSVSVDGSPGLDVGGDGGAEVSLLDDLLQSLHAVLSVGEDVLVDGLHSLVVVLESVLDLVGGVLGVLQTPSLGVANGALGRLVVVWLMVGLGLMVGSGVDGLVVRSSVVDRLVIGGSVVDRLVVRGWLVVGSSVVHRHLVIHRGHGGGVSNYGGDIAGHLGCVDGCGVVHWLHGAVGSGGGGVAVHSGVVDRDGASSLGLSLGMDCDGCSSQDLEMISL